MTKIFIVSHKKIEEDFSYPFIPLYVGAAANENFGLTDRTGDSIFEKNPHYSELTAQYWIWKNLLKKEDPNELIGFCHYRRFFSFDFLTHELNKIQKINHHANITKLLAGEKDVILPTQVEFPIKQHWFSWSILFRKLKFPWHNLTLSEQFSINHNYDDLQLATKLLPKIHQQGFIEHLNGKKLSPYNMYVAKPAVLNEYFNILFPWLFEFEKETSFNNRSSYQARLPGFIAERFASYYFSTIHNPCFVNVSFIKQS